MVKKYANLAFIYAILAMVFGVFYREFTKGMGYIGKTNLSVMHTHYFMLGMFFFLVLLLIGRDFTFSDKKTGIFIVLYQVGLNISGAGFLARGLVQVLVTELGRGADKGISGVCGIGHIIMGISMIVLLIKIKKSAAGSGSKE